MPSIFFRPGRTAITLVMAVCVCASGVACSPRAAVSTDQASVRIGAALPLITPGSGVPALVNGFTKEQLVSIGSEGRPIGRLVERWEPLPEGYGLRFHLRPNIKFHDGSPLTVDPRYLRAIGGHALTYKASPRSRRGWRARHQDGPPALSRTDSIQPSSAQRPHQDRAVRHHAQGCSDHTAEGVPGLYRGRPTVICRVRSYRTSARVSADARRIDAVHEVSRGAIEFVEAGRPSARIRRTSLLHPAPSTSRGAFKARAAPRAQSGGGPPSRHKPGHTAAAVANGPVWPLHWAHSTAAAPIHAA